MFSALYMAIQVNSSGKHFCHLNRVALPFFKKRYFYYLFLILGFTRLKMGINNVLVLPIQREPTQDNSA